MPGAGKKAILMDMQSDFSPPVIEPGSNRRGGQYGEGLQGRGVDFQILVIGAASALAPACGSPSSSSMVRKTL